MIYVFDSNEAGIHSTPAARTAVRHYRAQHHVGFGPSGKAFAIPTRDWRGDPLPLVVIEHYVQRFIVYARWNPEERFWLTPIASDLPMVHQDLIAPLFKYAPDNCFLDISWKEFLPKKQFWGGHP